MKHSPRRLAFLFSGTGAFLVAMASIAFACLPFKGSLTVAPQGGGTTGSTVVGDGSTSSHGYCTNPDGAHRRLVRQSAASRSP